MKYATSKDILSKGSMYAITPWKKEDYKFMKVWKKFPIIVF